MIYDETHTTILAVYPVI